MTGKQVQERRSHHRIAFDAPVVISNSERQWQSTLLDISLKGALVIKPDEWDSDAGRTWQLDIQLSGSDIHIQMEASVMHIEDDHIGFHCDHIDLDSITNLRHLVEMNLGNVSLLERELSSLSY